MRRGRRPRSNTATPRGPWAGADGLNSAAYYSTALNTGLLGQTNGPFYGQCWLRLDNQNVAAQRSIVSTRAGATTPTTTGYYVRALNNNTQIAFEVFVSAGAPVTSAVYTVQAADIGKVIHVGWCHTGAALQLFVRGVQVGSDVAAVGYVVPTQSTFIGRRANATSEHATDDVTICGLSGGNYAATPAEFLAAYQAGKAAGDVVEMPSAAHLWSFKRDGGAGATLVNRIGAANMARSGTPNYVAGMRAA